MPSLFFISIFIVSDIFIILSFSFIETFWLIISNVTHLYVAPVSILISPKSFAINFVIVPFPVPAGPSIATIKLIITLSFPLI